MAEYLGPELTNNLAKELLRNFPNTYTFTKTLAEELILSEASTLPICIFRPAISNYNLKTNYVQYFIVAIDLFILQLLPHMQSPHPVGWIIMLAQ